MILKNKKISVLIFTNLFPTPNDPERGIFTFQIVKELKKICNVFVVCPLPWFPKIRLFRHFSKWYRFSQIPFRYCIDGIRVISPKYLMVPKISERMHSVFLFLGSYPTVVRINRKRKFELINAQWLYPDGVAACWIARLIKSPLVLTGLGCDVNLFLLQKEKSKQIIRSLKYADGITVVSSALRNVIVDKRIGENKISIIPNGVDKEIFHMRSKIDCKNKLGIPLNKKIVLFVGQIIEVKGIDYLLEAVSTLKKSRDDFLVYMVGDGESRLYYESKAKSIGCGKEIIFIGPKKHRDISLWMGAATVLCLPSIREGWPNVIMEALSCGLPVVASNVGGIPEIVSEQSGVLVTKEDSCALAEGLNYALDKKWETNKITESVSQLSWANAAESYVKVFRRVIDEVRSREDKNAGSAGKSGR